MRRRISCLSSIICPPVSGKICWGRVRIHWILSESNKIIKSRRKYGQTEELSRREEQFLENVLENLRQRIGKIAQELEEGQKDIESMHEYYWENYTEMDQYGYEDYDNQQALLHRINANQEKLDLKHRFQKMLDSPFFRESGFYL